jgi:hypothetical protein
VDQIIIYIQLETWFFYLFGFYPYPIGSNFFFIHLGLFSYVFTGIGEITIPTGIYMFRIQVISIN